MEETFNIEGIVLKRAPFREADLAIELYTREKGRIGLVCRGARKQASKLRGHIEPLNQILGMAVRGRKFDYLGSAVSRRCYPDIKSELEKVRMAGKVVRTMNKMVGPGEPDAQVYSLILSALDNIGKSKSEKSGRVYIFFLLKIMMVQGFMPEFEKCTQCGEALQPEGNLFVVERAGAICPGCSRTSGNKSNFLISAGLIKVVRHLKNNPLDESLRIVVSKSLMKELINFSQHFVKYYFQ